MQVVRDLESLSEPPCRTVLTIGNFDGVHLGHREIFRRVVDKAHELKGTAVVVTFEPHPLRLLNPAKAPLQLNTPEEKVRLLAASCIDLLVVLNFTRQLAEMPAEDFVRDILVRKLGVKHLIVGYDYAFGRNRQGDVKFLAEQARVHNFSLEVLEPIRAEQQAHSSTAIRKILQEGRVAEAVKVLGRNFTLDGEVVHGVGRGRKLGFPTANLVTKKEILPRDGVYAVKVKWRDEYYDGVINIGCRPTFAASAPTLEIHLLDFQGDLYGERLRIYFVDRLRDELQFPSVEALKEAVAADVARARTLLAGSQVVEYREYLGDCQAPQA
ncbi:MAG: bifunctional riboflavin kinase/FAD synthetase [Desulfuromonadales bacterium]|nr:bifunctional riboflavin kinase/FAD synthetase [Desulfuromonadales bacterium]